MPALPQEITQLLSNWSQGDKAALDQLVALVYPELRRLARRHMAREDPAHTLQTSALINEAYLKLVDQKSVQWQSRAHFFAVAAQVMRHILVDHARTRNYAKRGGGAPKLPLDEAAALTEQRAAQLIALDDALNDLSALDGRKSQIIELRFFGGLSLEETAEVMKISPSTVQREWRAAKAWLHHAMSKTDES
ncbi:MAG TPA: sigma-70 family RNA polymerase sigma factor [Pyrinomonadaceae bacterium]|nr:sigma-70 family RNA polymerase sigma factor [Pyrinomonadaceae bacterium]